MKVNFVNVHTVVALCCMLLCSCNNNVGNGGEAGGDGSQVTAGKTDSVQTVKYDVNFGRDVYDFFDVEMVYTDVMGENVTRKITDNMQLTVKPGEMADSVMMRITARPKENMPDIDNARLYKWYVNCRMTVDAGKDMAKNYGSNSSMSMTGDKWRTFVAEERVVVSEVAEL